MFESDVNNASPPAGPTCSDNPPKKTISPRHKSQAQRRSWGLRCDTKRLQISDLGIKRPLHILYLTRNRPSKRKAWSKGRESEATAAKPNPHLNNGANKIVFFDFFA